MSDEEFIVVNIEVNPDISTLNKKTLELYIPRYKKNKALIGALRYYIRVVGPPIDAEVYENIMKLYPEFTALLVSDVSTYYPTNVGFGRVDDEKEPRALRHSDKVRIVGLENKFVVERISSTRDLRRIWYSIIETDKISQVVKHVISPPRGFTVGIGREDLILSTYKLPLYRILNIIIQLVSRNVYNVGERMQYSELLDAGVFGSESIENIIHDLKIFGVDKFQYTLSTAIEKMLFDVYGKKIGKKIIEERKKEYRDMITGQTYVINNCEHVIIVKNLYSSRRDVQVKRGLRKLAGYYDPEYDKEKLITCILCGMTILCPHQLVLLEKYGDTEYRKKLAMDKFIIHRPQLNSAICRICMIKIYNYSSSDEMESYNPNTYSYKDFSSDDVYGYIVKYMTMILRSEHVKLNQNVVGEKEFVEMAISIIYQFAKNSIQRYSAVNLASIDASPLVSITIVIIYCVIFIDVISEKIRIKNKTTEIVSFDNTIEDLISKLVDIYINRSNSDFYMDYSTIITDAFREINTNMFKQNIVRYIKTLEASRIVGRAKKEPSYNFLIPNKQIFGRTKFNYDVDLPNEFLMRPNQKFPGRAGVIFDIAHKISDGTIHQLAEPMPNIMYDYTKQVVQYTTPFSALPLMTPYHVRYDENGIPHEFVLDKNDKRVCRVCGWRFNDLDKYASRDSKIKAVLQLKDTLARMQTFCPILNWHKYDKNFVCISCGFRKDWTYTDEAFNAYLRKYHNILEPKLINLEYDKMPKSDTRDYQSRLQSSIKSTDMYVRMIGDSIGHDKTLAGQFNAIIRNTDKIMENIRTATRIINKVVFFDIQMHVGDSVFRDTYMRIGDKKIMEVRDEVNKILDIRHLLRDESRNKTQEDADLYNMYLRNQLAQVLHIAISISPVLFQLIISNILSIDILISKSKTQAINEPHVIHPDLHDAIEEEGYEDVVQVNDNLRPDLERDEDEIIDDDEPEDYENGRFLAGISKDED